MELNDLYAIAEQNEITVECYRMTNASSISVEIEGRDFIGIDPFRLENTADEKFKLAHDMGHCILGAFYNRSNPLSIKGKAERKANVWAIKKLVPEHELLAAIAEGYVEYYELAEYFEVPEPIIVMACNYYKGLM